MFRSRHQSANESMPVLHPRIVRYVVGAFLIGSLVRVCMGTTDVGGFAERQSPDSVPGQSLNFTADR